jgi:hypothetical protein
VQTKGVLKPRLIQEAGLGVALGKSDLGLALGVDSNPIHAV